MQMGKKIVCLGKGLVQEYWYRGIFRLLWLHQENPYREKIFIVGPGGKESASASRLNNRKFSVQFMYFGISFSPIA
jgi:hypothetical protein